MGIKVIKKIFSNVTLNLFQSLIVLALVILFSAPVFATDIVRVGLTDNNFQNLLKTSVSVYATDECEIYEKGTDHVLGNAQAYENITVMVKNSKFEIQIGDEIISTESDFVVTSPAGLLGVFGVNRKSQTALYRGDFELVRKTDSDNFYLVNVIDVEEYLKGVVPNEMPVRFGLEALKAQAISARNYALCPRTKAYKEFDVNDTVASQVYFGANTEMDLATKAIEETEGVLALYDNAPILAVYCSTAGGYTENYGYVFSDPVTKEFPVKNIPYLKAKPDMLTQTPLDTEEKVLEFYQNKMLSAYDMKSPYFRWSRHWEAEELRDILEKTLAEQSPVGFIRPRFNSEFKLGTIKEIKVIKRGDSGKIVELEIVAEGLNYKVFKEITIRRMFKKNGKALPSANVAFVHNYDEKTGKLVSIDCFGGGYGHGVGMSQFGAGFMATDLHKNFNEILKHYYTGINLGTKPVTLSTEDITQTFYTTKRKANLVIVNPDKKLEAVSLTINKKDVEIPIVKTADSKEFRMVLDDYLRKGKNTITYHSLAIENMAVNLYVELEEKDDEYYF